jgi:NAD(P)H-dependent flavin oxidoreductase YrpB (nitropropane dioxygenase family)
VEVRVVRNAVTDRWIAREGEIEARREEIMQGLAAAEERDDWNEIDLLAGEGSARIESVRPAGELVTDLGRTAREASGG